MKASFAILFMATSGCVMHQHLGSMGDAVDADVAKDAQNLVDAQNQVDGGTPDIGSLDAKLDIEKDGSNLSISSASCSDSCGCERADICRLECTGSGCAATCGVSRSCYIELLGRNSAGDCRSAASCDVACSASCLVDCGARPCKVACARGQICAVKCGSSLPTICPDGVTVVCNGEGC